MSTGNLVAAAMVISIGGFYVGMGLGAHVAPHLDRDHTDLFFWLVGGCLTLLGVLLPWTLHDGR